MQTSKSKPILTAERHKINGMIENKLKDQIRSWQIKWDVLQELINEKIKEEDYASALRMQIVATTLKSCIKEAYGILDTNRIEPL